MYIYIYLFILDTKCKCTSSSHCEVMPLNIRQILKQVFTDESFEHTIKIITSTNIICVRSD